MHPAYNTVKEMTEREWMTYRSSPYNNSLEEYMREHLEWLVLTKVQYQIVLGKPMIVRRIYTKAWDEMLYRREIPWIDSILMVHMGFLIKASIL